MTAQSDGLETEPHIQLWANGKDIRRFQANILSLTYPLLKSLEIWDKLAVLLRCSSNIRVNNE